MNTCVEYLYRDAANYKRYGSALLDGELATADIEAIRSKLDMGELFVAEQVGLPSLRGELLVDGLTLSCLDHGWHSLVSIRPAEEVGPTLMPASALVARFAAVRDWKLSLAASYV